MSMLLYGCGLCCALISVWGTLQLVLMGVFYYMEAVTLLEDAKEEEYEDYDDFITKTKKNYRAIAINCWVAAVIYALSLGLSFLCMNKANKKWRAEALLQEDEEYVCAPKPPPKPKKKQKEIE